MLFSRKEFLALTGLKIEDFKSRFRRKQLPLMDSLFIAEGAEESPQRRYASVEILMTILADELARDGGLDRFVAARIMNEGEPKDVLKAGFSVRLVEGNIDRVFFALNKIAAGEPGPFFLSFARHRDMPMYWQASFAVTLPEIAEEWLREGPLGEGSKKIGSIFIVSVTDAVETLRERAKEHGVKINEPWA